jgi:hypothetical protein
MNESVKNGGEYSSAADGAKYFMNHHNLVLTKLLC